MIEVGVRLAAGADGDDELAAEAAPTTRCSIADAASSSGNTLSTAGRTRPSSTIAAKFGHVSPVSLLISPVRRCRTNGEVGAALQLPLHTVGPAASVSAPAATSVPPAVSGTAARRTGG